MKRQLYEKAVQRAVVDHIRLRGVPGLVFFHVPNGGRRSIREAAEFKRQGVLAGVADLILLHNSKFFALELKADKGRMSETQLAFRDNVNAAGGYAAWADGIDAALSVLKAWGLLKG